MRLLLTGKGGSGKTTIAGTLARLLARRGEPVIALDFDTNPNLAVALGLSETAADSVEPVLNVLIANGVAGSAAPPDPQAAPWRFPSGKPAVEDLVSRYGVLTGDGVTLLTAAKVELPTNRCLGGFRSAGRELFGNLAPEDGWVVMDAEAGVEGLAWAAPEAGDIVLVVAEPSARSVEVARRAARMAREAGVTNLVGVANRSDRLGDADRLAEALGSEVISVPEDPLVRRADRLGAAPLDLDGSSPAMNAIDSLASRLLARRCT